MEEELISPILIEKVFDNLFIVHFTGRLFVKYVLKEKKKMDNKQVIRHLLNEYWWN